MHLFMKVFHIFMTSVNKQQHKVSSTSENVQKSKFPNRCVVEDILEYHRIVTLDFKDKFWENDDSSVPWYIFFRLYQRLMFNST